MPREGLVARRVHSPPFSRRGGCASIRRSRSLGRRRVVTKRSRSLLIDVRVALHFCLKLLTTPSAPVRNGILLLMAQPPLLGKRRGMGPSRNQTFPLLSQFSSEVNMSNDISLRLPICSRGKPNQRTNWSLDDSRITQR